MTWLYTFMLAAGAPLLLWFVISGGDSEAEAGADAEGLSSVFTIIPLSSLAFLSTFFGATGLVTEWAGSGPIVALLMAVVVGVLAAGLNAVAFAFLRRSESSSEVTDRELEGSIARVLMPLSKTQRGRIVLDVAGARTQMTALPIDSHATIEPGSRVIVVRIEGGVALVTPLDPELE